MAQRKEKLPKRHYPVTHGRLAIISRPITPDRDAFLLLQEGESLAPYTFHHNAPISFAIVDDTKYCTGWYDIATHTNHVCENQARVDASYDSCFACRNKTNFNPAFYNTSDISEKQSAYNNLPHSVYIAYFGNNVAKAGIMSDSRKQERLYEQGALLYTIIASCPNAYTAHNLEQQLIERGLKNSINKKQKSVVFEKAIDIAAETQTFKSLLSSFGYKNALIVSNFDLFFFGEYPNQPIQPFVDPRISGTIRGIVGSYLILDNNERLYGYWLPGLYGHRVTIDTEITPLDRSPEQVSLF